MCHNAQGKCITSDVYLDGFIIVGNSRRVPLDLLLVGEVRAAHSFRALINSRASSVCTGWDTHRFNPWLLSPRPKRGAHHICVSVRRAAFVLQRCDTRWQCGRGFYISRTSTRPCLFHSHCFSCTQGRGGHWSPSKGYKNIYSLTHHYKWCDSFLRIHWCSSFVFVFI